MLDAEFTSKTTVARYAGLLGDMSEAERESRLQTLRSNIIRAFFIANGRRLLPEQPDWMKT